MSRSRRRQPTGLATDAHVPPSCIICVIIPGGPQPLAGATNASLGAPPSTPASSLERAPRSVARSPPALTAPARRPVRRAEDKAIHRRWKEEQQMASMNPESPRLSDHPPSTAGADERAREVEAQMTDEERFSLIISLLGGLPSYGIPRDPRIPDDVDNMSAGYTAGVPR